MWIIIKAERVGESNDCVDRVSVESGGLGLWLVPVGARYRVGRAPTLRPFRELDPVKGALELGLLAGEWRLHYQVQREGRYQEGPAIHIVGEVIEGRSLLRVSGAHTGFSVDFEMGGPLPVLGEARSGVSRYEREGLL
jgi:hypothetical protein